MEGRLDLPSSPSEFEAVYWYLSVNGEASATNAACLLESAVSQLLANPERPVRSIVFEAQDALPQAFLGLTIFFDSA